MWYVFAFLLGIAVMEPSPDLVKPWQDYKEQQRLSCEKYNCCYDKSWDRVVCKNWESQVNMQRPKKESK